jgi:hypothetical protein
MIYVLRYLHKNITPHEELVDGLADDLSNMTTEIEKFGSQNLFLGEIAF